MAETARQRFRIAAHVPVEEVEVVRVNGMDGTTTCLELKGMDECCEQALTPGWRIVLRAEGEEYKAHTDLGADTVRIKE